MNHRQVGHDEGLGRKRREEEEEEDVALKTHM